MPCKKPSFAFYASSKSGRGFATYAPGWRRPHGTWLWTGGVSWVPFRWKKRPKRFETSAPGGANAEEVAAQSQMIALVERLIASLPKELRDPLTLATVEELTSAEIGEILGIPEGSVRERISRARHVLGGKLAGLMEKSRGR
jgi:RNA polymerase sigma-70 factor (ECF subfamily)